MRLFSSAIHKLDNDHDNDEAEQSVLWENYEFLLLLDAFWNHNTGPETTQPRSGSSPGALFLIWGRVGLGWVRLVWVGSGWFGLVWVGCQHVIKLNHCR